MSLFSKLKLSSVESRKSDERPYAVVASEMEQGIRNSALWIKAIAEANGNDEKQISSYIKLRVQSLKDDLDLIQSELKKKKDFVNALPHNPPQNVLGSLGSLRYWLAQQNSKYKNMTDVELQEILEEYRD